MSNENVKKFETKNNGPIDADEATFLLEVLNQQGIAFPASARKILSSTMDKLEAIAGNETGN